MSMQQDNEVSSMNDAADEVMTVGQILRTAREAQGLSVNDVANRIKFATKQIEWLEEDDFVKLPEAAFVRGFVRSYARMLELDTAHLLSMLPSSHVQKVQAPEIKPVDIPLTSSKSMSRYNIVLLVAILVVAVTVAVFDRMKDRGNGQAAASSSRTVVQALDLPGSTPGVAVEESSSQDADAAKMEQDSAAVAQEPPAVNVPAVEPAPIAAPVVVAPAPVSKPSPVMPSAPVVQVVKPSPVLPAAPASPIAQPSPVLPSVPVVQSVKPSPVLPSSPPAPVVAKPAPVIAPAPEVAPKTAAPKKEVKPDLASTPKPAAPAGQLSSLQPWLMQPAAKPAVPEESIKHSNQVAPRVVSPVSASFDHSLRLEFDEDAWAEVKDASGNIMISKMHLAGSLVRISGKGPLNVVIGNSKAVRLFDNGKKINLEKYTTAEVAHITLK